MLLFSDRTQQVVDVNVTFYEALIVVCYSKETAGDKSVFLLPPESATE